MNVEIGTEAAEAGQFLYWEYISGIFVAVQDCPHSRVSTKCTPCGHHAQASLSP
jgi:hypothetical protein